MAQERPVCAEIVVRLGLGVSPVMVTATGVWGAREERVSTVQSGAESWTGSGLNIWHTTTSPSPVRDRETGAKKSIGTNIRILKTNDLKSSN